MKESIKKFLLGNKPYERDYDTYPETESERKSKAFIEKANAALEKHKDNPRYSPERVAQLKIELAEREKEKQKKIQAIRESLGIAHLTADEAHALVTKNFEEANKREASSPVPNNPEPYRPDPNRPLWQKEAEMFSPENVKWRAENRINFMMQTASPEQRNVTWSAKAEQVLRGAGVEKRDWSHIQSTYQVPKPPNAGASAAGADGKDEVHSRGGAKPEVGHH